MTAHVTTTTSSQSQLSTNTVPSVALKSGFQAKELLSKFLLALKANNCSGSTIRNYRSDINQFLHFSGSDELTIALTKPKLSAFVRYEKEKGLKDSSIVRKLASITQFVIWITHEHPELSAISWVPELDTRAFAQNPEFAEFTATPAPHVALAPTQVQPPSPSQDAVIVQAPLQGPLQAPVQAPVQAPLQALVQAPELRPTPVQPQTPEVTTAPAEDTTPAPTRITARHIHKSGSFKKKLQGIKLASWARIVPYLNLALMVFFFLGLGVFGYQQLISETPSPLAYPSTPVAPSRVLSFQGRVTDAAQNPITTATNMRFFLYNSGPSTSGGTQLWDSGTCSVDPDQDGIFSVGLGSDCGSAITENVFSENSAVWLQVQIGAETLSPRQPIRTVPYALNSETVQGYPISATGAATVNTLLFMDGGGSVVLGETNPEIRSTSGTFTIEGASLLFQTRSNGDIIFDANGTGAIKLQDYLFAPGATLSATYAGGIGLVVKGGPSGTANIQEWQNSSSSVVASVDASGNLIVNQTIGVSGDTDLLSLASNALTVNGSISGTTITGSGNINSSGGTLQTGGTTRVDNSGNLANIGTTQLNGITYTWPGSQTTNYILQTNGSGTLSWADPALVVASSNYWEQLNGALYAKNNTVDLLIGGNASDSADFAFINVNSGTPTASISGNLVLNSAGVIQTTLNRSLTIGGGTTGDIILSPLNGAGKIGIGTSSPDGKLHLTGAATGKALAIFNQTGDQDVFVASTSGTAVFRVDNTGFAYANRLVDISNTNYYLDPAATGTSFAIAGSAAIGSTATSSRLDVTSSGTNTDVQRWLASDGSRLGRFTETSGGAGWFEVDNAAGTAIFLVRADAGDSYFNSGEFGFGTTSPNAKVESLATTEQLRLSYDASNYVSFTTSSAGNLTIDTQGSGGVTFADNIAVNGGGITSSGSLAITPTTSLTLNSTGTLNIDSSVDVVIDADGADVFFRDGAADFATFTNSSTDLTLDIAGGNLLLANGDVLNAGGAGAAAYNFFAGATTNNTTADGDNDLYIEDELEVDGAVRFDNASLTFSTFTNNGGLLYTNGSGVLAQTSIGSLGECLQSAGGGSPTWGACAGANYWRISNGAISPTNDTLDLLVGSTASSSAKFAVLNVLTGTPTASVSAGTAGGAYLTATGNLATTANQNLTLGGATTGNISLTPLNGSGTVAVTGALSTSGNIDINGTANDIAGTLNLSGNTLTATGDLGINPAGGDTTITGTLTTTGDLAVNGDDITTDGPLTITPTTTLTLNSTGNLTLDSSADILLDADGADIFLQDGGVTFATLTNSSNDLSLDVAGGNFLLADGDVLNVGGAAAAAYNFFAGSTAGVSTPDGDNDLYIEDELEVDGTTRFGNLTYTWPGSQSTNYILQTDGSGTLSWVDPSTITASVTYWTQSQGALFPKNSTVDFLIGGQATDSAKFAVTNMTAARGSQVATLSGSLVLDAAGSLQTTRNQTLTIGGNTTGDITLAPLNGSGTVTSTGNFNLSSGKAYSINNASVLNATTLGTGVTTSSLTTVGALASGSITTGFGTIATNNTITGTTLNGTTGINTGASAGTQRIDSSGNLVNIGNLTASGDLTIDASGGNVLLANNDTLNVGGAAAAVYNFFAGATTNNTTADGDNDLYIEDELEVDGAVRFDNASLTFSTFTANGGLLYTNGSGVLAQTTAGSAGECLASAGGGAPTWTTCGGTNYWQLNAGSLSPFSLTADINLGATATASAKVSLAGSLTRGKAVAIFNQTENQDIIAASASGTAVFKIDNSGYAHAHRFVDFSNNSYFLDPAATGTALTVAGQVGIGTTSPVSFLHVTGKVTGKALSIFDETGDQDIFTASASGTTRFVITNAGNVGIGVTNPTSKLQIAGSASTISNSSGDITIDSVADIILDADGADIFFKDAATTFATFTNSTTDLTLDIAGGNLLLANGDVLNVGGGAAAAYNFFADSVAGNTLAVGDNDVYIEDDLEIDGQLRIGNLTYTFPTTQSANYILMSNGSGTLSWVHPDTARPEFWQLNSGALSPISLTTDINLGATATASARISLAGSLTRGKALVMLNQTENQDIIAASASGTTVFRVDNAGYAHAHRYVDYSNSSYFLDPAATGDSLLVAGNIGVNTTSATEKLDVRGNATISGTVAIGVTNQGGAGTCNAAAEGKMYYDKDTNFYRYCNGTSWTDFSSGSGGLTSNEASVADGSSLDVTHNYGTSNLITDAWVYDASSAAYIRIDESQGTNHNPDDAGLKGFWKMDEASGDLADSSRSNNTLIDKASPTYQTSSGKVNRAGAINFDSADADYFCTGSVTTCADDSEFDNNGSLTVGGWVKVDSMSGSAQMIASKYTTNDGIFQLHHTNGAVGFDLFNTGAATSYMSISSSGNIADGQWHYVVGMFNSTTTRAELYIDGKLVGVDATTSGSRDTDSAAGLALGYRLDLPGVAFAFDGLMDEMFFYSRALTPAEIESLYQYGARKYRIEQPSTSVSRIYNYSGVTKTLKMVVASALGNGTVDLTASAFNASASGSQTFGIGWSKVQFATENFDANNEFDNATNYRFQPTRAGYYQVNYYLQTDASTANQEIRGALYKNGASLQQRMMSYFAAGSRGHLEINNVIYLNGSTDYIEAYAYNSQSTSRTVQGDSYFSAAATGAGGGGAGNGSLYDTHRQNDTTNSTVNSQVVRKGWGYITGDGTLGSSGKSESVSYGITYDSAPLVLVSTAGIKSTTAPTTIDECNTVAPALYSAHSDSISTTAFDTNLFMASGTFAASTYYCYTWMSIGTYVTGYGADLAENYLTYDLSVEAADLVAIDRSKDIAVTKQTTGAGNYAIGVVSTQPGITLGPEDGRTGGVSTSVTGQEVATGAAKVLPIALEGRVPVKVSLEGGIVRKGDALTMSSIAGVAKKATEAGHIVGYALEDWDGTSTIVDVVTQDTKIATDSAWVKSQLEKDSFADLDNGIGKVMILVKPGYHEPALNETVTIEQATPATSAGVLSFIRNSYIVRNTVGAVIERVTVFSQATIAQLEAGLVNTREVLANIIRTDRTETRELATDLISPLAGGDVTIRLGSRSASDSATATDSAQLRIENASGSAVATFDDQGNASLLGSLLAEGGVQTSTLSAETATIAGELTATSGRISYLEGKVAELENIKAQTADIVNATISGTLYADDIFEFEDKVARALEQPSLLSKLLGTADNNRQSYDTTAAAASDLVATTYPAATSSAVGARSLAKKLSDLNLSSTDVSLEAEAVYINQYFQVNGSGYVAGSLGIEQNVLIGQTTRIADGVIEYNPTADHIAAGASPALQIQPSGKGLLSLMAGLMTLDDKGQVNITGDLNVAGNLKVEDTLLTNLVKPTDFTNPLQVQLASRSGDVAGTSTEVQKSRFEIVNELGTPVATISAEGKASFAGLNISADRLDSEEPTTDKTSGKAVLKSGKSEIVVRASSVTTDSLIYVTPIGSTENQVLFVKSQAADNPETSENEAQFTVGFDTSISKDVQFNWWIVN